MAEQSSSRRNAGNDNKTDETGSGNSPDAENAEAANRSLATDLVMALRFYSRLPVPGAGHAKPNLSHMAPALPFASLLIGAGPALVLFLGSVIGLPPLFAAVLAIACLTIVTGAMAEDAIADSADGLFGGQTIEKRLEILKDSRHGTYGVTALVLFLLLRAGALATLAAHSPLGAATAWLAAGILSRSGSLWLTLQLLPARRDGASSAAGGVGKVPFIAGAGFAVVLGFIFAAPFVSVAGLAGAIVLQALVALGWTQLCRHLVGGQTGDLIGGLQALLEIAALSVFIVLVGL